jgi:hypothetical protein
MDAHQAVNLALLRQFNALEISFAFPTRTIIQETVDRGPVEGPPAAKAALTAPPTSSAPPEQAADA